MASFLRKLKNGRGRRESRKQFIKPELEDASQSQNLKAELEIIIILGSCGVVIFFIRHSFLIFILC